MRTLLIAFIFAAAVAAQVRDTKPAAPTAKPGPTGTGVISGVVTSDEGSRPVRFAYIVLLGTTTGIVKVSSSDVDGRFTFSALPADRYTVGASKPPFLGTIAGANRPARPGTPIAVADGQKISNVSIRMPMGAAITGVITTDKGQPAAGVLVGLMQWRVQNGERTLVQVPGVQVNIGGTDELGRYRIFGLPPGEYFVTAMAMSTAAPPVRLSAADVDAALKGNVPAFGPPVPATPTRNAPIYYPGTPRSTDAGAIVLTVGEERSNVDFRLETVQTARVEGSVATSDGQPLGDVSVILSAVSNILQFAMSIRVRPDGGFNIPSVAPGAYRLQVAGQGPQAGQFASTSIEVAGADVFGVRLTMRPALSVPARLVFEGRASLPALNGRRIPVRTLGAGPAGAAAPQTTSTDPTGAFVLSNLLPSRYLIGGPLSFGPTADTMTWSLQSVIVDGRDVTDLPVDITDDSVPKNIVVTYGDRVQELSGRLQSQSGAPVSDYTIIVFPEDKAYWLHGTRRIVIARPGTDGRFVLSGPGPTTLPPGQYLLAAATDIGRDEQFDPAFLAQLVPASVAITLGPGEKKVQDLAIK